MKRLAAFVIMASLAGLVGCHGNQSGTGGTPKPTGGTGGAKPTGGGTGGEKGGGTAKAGSFTIVQDKPGGTVDVTQGDMLPIELGIKRDNYGGNVEVKAVPAAGPQGVKQTDVPNFLKVDLKPKVFPGNNPDQKLILEVGAAADAPVGDYGIQVTGTPAKEGDKATSKPLEIKVHVKKKK